MKFITLVVLVFFCFGCSVSSPALTTATTARPTSVATLTATNTPRWVEYEDALFQAIFPKSPAYGLCEWSILGISKNEVYIWALCRSMQADFSTPAVIVLDDQGEIREVKIPGPDSMHARDVHAWFPPAAQTQMVNGTSHKTIDSDYLDQRQLKGGPPLIATLGTPMP